MKLSKLRKRGQQSGTEAALLVLTITVVIVIYVMFLPASERAELLGSGSDDDDNSGSSNSGSIKYNKTLVDESPGKLDYLNQHSYTHDIPSINLYTKTNAEIFSEIPPFIIKNNWFEKKFKTISFDLDDTNSDNVQLSFLVKDKSGLLSIYLNDNQIYESDPSSLSVAIELPKEHLKNTNEVTFAVSDVGPKFWTSNIYTFDNVMITGDFTDTSGHGSSNIFTISSNEFYNLESAELKFLPQCAATEVGRLNAIINGKNVYSSVPDCGHPTSPIDVTESVQPGENTLQFETDKGQILVDLIKVTTELEEFEYPNYYFELQDKWYTDINKNRTELNLTLKFVDDYESKNAKIYVNGARTYMFTKDNEFTFNMRPYIDKGINSVRIEPYGDDLEIRRVIVHLK